MVEYEDEHGWHRNAAIGTFAEGIGQNAVAEQMHQPPVHVHGEDAQLGGQQHRHLVYNSRKGRPRVSIIDFLFFFFPLLGSPMQSRSTKK
jgi:hypothetical protein